MTPVCIITGFLGSGKTTLVNHILAYPVYKDSLVIINEFGEIGIDHLLVSHASENVHLLASGCMCCKVRGDMVETLSHVIHKRAVGEIPAFDRIFIETSGLADPFPIVQTLLCDQELSPFFRLDGVVGVIDAFNASSQLESYYEAQKQVAISDVLLLTKTDLVSAADLADVERAIRQLNNGARLVRTQHGKVSPHLLFDFGQAADLQRWLERGSKALDDSRLIGASHADTLDGNRIRSFALFHRGCATEAELATWLSMLASFKGPQLLRVKGIVNVAGRPFVIHALQSLVHEPVELEEWPLADHRTRLVFITRNIGREVIERSFEIFDIASTFRDKCEIDPKAYARFCDAAMHLL
jgi:G3E family GTPase